jgi:hypothetical protein
MRSHPGSRGRPEGPLGRRRLRHAPRDLQICDAEGIEVEVLDIRVGQCPGMSLEAGLILKAMDLAEWHMWWKQRGAAGVRRILMEWDPIGVADTPEAVDEYDSYLGPIGARRREGAPVIAIQSYLRHVRETLMGLDAPSWRPRDRTTAERLIEWSAAETRPSGA